MKRENAEKKQRASGPASSSKAPKDPKPRKQKRSKRAKETETRTGAAPAISKERRRYNSLRMTLIYFVFTLMVLSGIITGTIITVLHLVFGFLNFFVTAPITLLLVIFLPSIIIGSVLAIVLSSSILRPLRDTIRAARKLGEGDFSVRVENDRGIYEVAELQRAFNHMAEDLSRLEILRKDFINNFSHEFKTPIVSIRGFAHELRYGDLSEDKRAEYLEIICKESDRLTHMASRILTLSQYENLSIVTEKTSYDLDEQIRHCILLLEKQWDEKNLELDIDLETVRCYSNEEMLSQLWVNLLGNAVKFTPAGGTVGVSLRQEGDTAIVRVSDTGDGIPEEIRDRIFDRFYQGDTSHKSEGNGIGLTLVRRIVELCRGTITVESEEGKGSVFTVRLPIAETVAELEG